MADTPKQTRRGTTTPSGAASTPATPSGDGSREAATVSPRLSVQLTDDGARIAWDRLRADSREKLRRVLADPEAVKQLGATMPAATVTVDPMICGVLYDALSSIAVSLARASGYAVDRAAVLRFNDEEKAMLAAPTAAVFAKYSDALGAYQEEFTLAMLLFAILSGKVAVLRASDDALVPGPGWGKAATVVAPTHPQ